MSTITRFKLTKQQASKFNTHDKQMVRDCVMSACHSLSTDHPEWRISDEAASSLAKRVNAVLSNKLDRLLSDRAMLNWLENHRYEWERLSKIRGGLRQVLYEEIMSKQVVTK